jgi:RHS repeat-associated protein
MAAYPSAWQARRPRLVLDVLLYDAVGNVLTIADGNLVKKEDPAVGVTYYVGAHYEVLVPAVMPPVPPTDLEACRASGSPPDVCNDLTWTGSSGVTYNVYRSTTSPVPIDAEHRIASGLTETEYTDCGKVNNRYYAVTAVNDQGESGPSNEARASEPCDSAMAMTLPALNTTALIESGGEPVVTRYYFFNGQRVAMRRNGVVYYLLADHLASTSLVIDANGAQVGPTLRYYPYGGIRYPDDPSTFPTDYRFTGQRHDGYIKLYAMGARFYDPSLGRWISADTIIPDPANPQSYNRYSYTLGNPLRFIDPSGHDPLDAAWQEEFRAVHGREPTAEDILIRLFSIAFPDEWSRDTWNNLYTANGQLRAGAIQILFQRPPEGRDWANMPDATSHMASWYNEGETADLIRDIGSLFAGLANRSESNWVQAVTGGGASPSIWIGRDGLPDELLGGDLTGNVHHWAWTLNLGHFLGRAIGRGINTAREGGGADCDANCQADRALGAIGADMGSFMSRGLRSARSPHEFQEAWRLMPALQVNDQ